MKSQTAYTILNAALFVGLFYLFILSISLMGAAFKLFGSDLAEQLIATTSNPFIGLMIGILATSIIQSSSTTSSLVVGLVGAGALNITNAIPIVMGANVGTSITNTIVSLGHVSRSDEFKRAFAGATVHDFFNLIAVIVFLPLQISTNFLGISAQTVASAFETAGGLKTVSPIKLITGPAIELIEIVTVHSPIIMLILSFVFLFTALRYITVVLKSLVMGKLEVLFDRYIFKTPVRSFCFGLLVTVLVQSSSITTSIAIPLIGAGALSLVQVFPYTLGANIGTTITAMLAALATGQITAVTVAFAHFLFNLFGTILAVPLYRLPIFLATKLAEAAIKNRIIPLIYIAVVFFLIPLGCVYLIR